MRQVFRETIDLLKETFSDWREDNASRLAAALAYYAVVSLAPLIIISVAIAGFVLGPDAARGEIAAQLRGLIGLHGAEVIEEIITRANKPSSGVVATVVGVATLLAGASGVFGALQDGLNTVWEVTPKAGRGILGVIKDRFLSFAMVLTVGFLLLVSLLTSAALAAAGEYIGDSLLLPSSVLALFNFLLSFGVITVLFALVYKFLPDVKIAWNDVWIGAATTSLLFTIGKTLIGLYLGRSTVGSAYGAAGSLIVILIWVYYSAQILFFGAELTQVYANRYGHRITTRSSAIPATDEARAQQGLPPRKHDR